MRALLLLLTSAAVHGAEPTSIPSAKPLTMIGEIQSVQVDGMFTLRSSAGVSVLVYSRSAQIRDLKVGDRVEVQGVEPRDYVRLAKVEIQATKVLPL